MFQFAWRTLIAAYLGKMVHSQVEVFASLLFLSQIKKLSSPFDRTVNRWIVLVTIYSQNVQINNIKCLVVRIISLTLGWVALLVKVQVFFYFRHAKRACIISIVRFTPSPTFFYLFKHVVLIGCFAFNVVRGVLVHSPHDSSSSVWPWLCSFTSLLAHRFQVLFSYLNAW